MKLTIGRKILFGYFPVLILIFTTTFFALLQLNRLNRINREIIKKDLVVNKAADAMIELLLAQESFGQRYMILKSQDILSLFWKRDLEFIDQLEALKALVETAPFSQLDSLPDVHHKYTRYVQKCFKHCDSTASEAFREADALRKQMFERQLALLHDLLSASRNNQIEKTGQTAAIGRFTFRALFVISIAGVALAVLIALFITNNILASIRALKVASGLVAMGKFKSLPIVTSGDELGELSLAFNEMGNRLSALEEISMDASPLTRLPGGIAVENCVKNKIERAEPFAFCLFDLDNFKPFNDRYGYSRGNAVIKETAQLILECAKKTDSGQNFVGHIGGDDFVLITTPEGFRPVCEKVIAEFDRRIVDFYNPEDRQKGFIHSKNRKGEKLVFPIMTISISALDSVQSPVENYIEVGEIIAELKKYAKTFSTSNLVVDRRGGKKRSIKK